MAKSPGDVVEEEDWVDGVSSLKERLESVYNTLNLDYDNTSCGVDWNEWSDIEGEDEVGTSADSISKSQIHEMRDRIQWAWERKCSTHNNTVDTSVDNTYNENDDDTYEYNDNSNDYDNVLTGHNITVDNDDRVDEYAINLNDNYLAVNMSAETSHLDDDCGTNYPSDNSTDNTTYENDVETGYENNDNDSARSGNETGDDGDYDSGHDPYNYPGDESGDNGMYCNGQNTFVYNGHDSGEKTGENTGVNVVNYVCDI
jgi:hypothetical protein